MPTSKEESTEQVLGRISASAVERIELIRGGAEMYGHAVLANVVRTKSVSLRGRAEVDGSVNTTGSTMPKLSLNLTRQGTDSVLDVVGPLWPQHRQQYRLRHAQPLRAGRHLAAPGRLRFSPP